MHTHHEGSCVSWKDDRSGWPSQSVWFGTAAGQGGAYRTSDLFATDREGPCGAACFNVATWCTALQRRKARLPTSPHRNRRAPCMASPQRALCAWLLAVCIPCPTLAMPCRYSLRLRPWRPFPLMGHCVQGISHLVLSRRGHSHLVADACSRSRRSTRGTARRQR